MTNNTSILKTILIYAAGLITGVCGYSLYINMSINDLPKSAYLEKRTGTHEFINPLLECNNPQASTVLESGNTNPLIQETLQDYLALNEKTSSISQISVYFKNLANGESFGVNENMLIRPGSLLKVPLLIGYYKRSENNPELLQEKILFNDKSQLELYEVQFIQPNKKLKFGAEYTIKELMINTILYSDNIAATLLEKYDNHSGLRKTALDLDIPIRPHVKPDRDLTVKEYSSFFQILYNSTYLSQSNSNEFLRLLSSSEFKDGLVSGVPKNILVAHKFGESIDPTDESVYYFSDCGIIYYPQSPYLLCVSVKGKKVASMIKAIHDVSMLVYKNIEIQNQTLAKISDKRKNSN